MKFHETSAKDGKNVQLAFESIIHDMYESVCIDQNFNVVNIIPDEVIINSTADEKKVDNRCC